MAVRMRLSGVVSAWVAVSMLGRLREGVAGGLAGGRERWSGQLVDRTPDAEEPAGWRALDLRLVPLAGAAWAGGWLGTSGVSGLVAFSAVGVVVLGLAAALRRSAWLVAIALVLAATTGIGVVRTSGLTSGPVAELAAAEAVVTADLITTGDPRIHPATGIRPPFVTVPADLLELDARGRGWRLRDAGPAQRDGR